MLDKGTLVIILAAIGMVILGILRGINMISESNFSTMFTALFVSVTTGTIVYQAVARSENKN